MNVDEIVDQVSQQKTPAQQQAGFSVDDVVDQETIKNDPMYRIIQSAAARGVDPEELKRLTATGITPGTVGDWSRLRMAQQQEQQGSPLDPKQAQAIYDIMNRIALSRQPETAQQTPEFKPTQPGGVENFLRSAIGANFGGLAYGAQTGLADIVGMFDERAAENINAAAQNSAQFQPQDASLLNELAGGIAGGYPYMRASNPILALTAGVNQAGLAAADVERRRQQGQDISTGAAMTNILGRGTVGTIMTRLGQKNITGPTSVKILEKFIPQVAKNVVGRIGAVGAGEAGIGAANQMLNNLIEIETGVNPDLKLSEGVWKAALIQGGMGSAFRGLHERGISKMSDQELSEAVKKSGRQPGTREQNLAFLKDYGTLENTRPTEGESPVIGLEGEQAQTPPPPPPSQPEAQPATTPEAPVMDAEQQARFSEPIQTGYPQRTPKRVYSQGELKAMNSQRLRRAAADAGVIFDTPGTTIPRILDAQETARSTRISEAQQNAQRIISENRRNEIATMSDQELYAAVKAAGGKASNRLANIDFLLKKEFPEAPTPPPAPTPEPVKPAEAPPAPAPEKPVIQPPEPPQPPEPAPVVKPVEQPPKPPEQPQPAEVDPRIREIDDAIKLLEDQIPNAKGKEKASIQDRIEMLKIIKSRPAPAPEPAPKPAPSPEPTPEPSLDLSKFPEDESKLSPMQKFRLSQVRGMEEAARKTKSLESMESTKALSGQPEPPKIKTPRQFTRAGIERQLMEAYNETEGASRDVEIEKTYESTGVNPGRTFYHPDAPATPTPAAGGLWNLLPGEVRNFLEGKANLRKKFLVTSDPSKSHGEDIMASDPNYFENVEFGGAARKRLAIEWAKNHPDPEMQLLAQIHEDMPPMKDRGNTDIIEPGKQEPGTTFKLFGRDYEIIEDPDTGILTLRDGPDFNPLPAEALTKMPVDAGTLEKPQAEAKFAPPAQPKQPPEAPDVKTVPEPVKTPEAVPEAQPAKMTPPEGLKQDTDLFGRPAFKAQGNKQEEMIFAHEPVPNPRETAPIEDVPGQTKMFGEKPTPKVAPDDVAPFLPEADQKPAAELTDAETDASLKKLGVTVKRTLPGKDVSFASKILQTVTGRKVVNCSKITGDMGSGNIRTMAGFVDPNTGTIYINANKPLAGYVSVFAHEWMHTLQKYAPEVSKSFYDAIPERLRSQYLNEYIARAGGKKAFDAYVARNGQQQIEMEIGAMAMGDAANRVRVRNALLRKDPKIWERAVDIWERFSDKIRGKSDMIDKALDVIGRDNRNVPSDIQAAKAPSFLPGENPLPKDVRRRDELRKGAISAETLKADFAVKEMKDAIKEGWGIKATKLNDVQLNAIDERLRGQQQSAPLPKSLEGAIDKARTHLDKLEFELMNVGLLDPQVVAFNQLTRGKYLNRAYRIFEDPSFKPSESSRQALEMEFANSQNLSPKEAKVAVEQLEADWKEGGIDAYLGHGKLGKKNLSILKQRKDLTPAMREFMGEYTDPFSNYVRSASKMSSLLENQKFLNDVKMIGKRNGWLFEEGKAEPGYTTRIAAEGSAVMSPLNGMRTSPEIAKAFTDAAMRSSDVLVDTGRAIALANYAAKSAVTLGSLRFHVRNLLQQPMFSLANGHFSVGKYAKAAKAAMDVLMKSGDVGYLETLKKLGILGQGVHAREMLADLKATGLTDMDLSQPGWKNAIMAKSRAALKAPGKFAGLIDDFGKIYGFENELARAKEAFPSWKLSEQQEWAANRVLDTYPTYSRVPLIVRKFGRVGGLFKAPFVSFWSESIRTIGNNILYAASDLASKNPALMKHGAQRLAGLTLALGGSVAAAAASKKLFDVSDKDEERNRAGLADWQKDNTLIWTSKDRFYDSSVFTPYNQLIDPIMTLLTGKGDITNRMSRAITQGLAPITSDQLTNSIYKDIIKNKTRDGVQIYSREDWESDDIAKKAKAWADMTGYVVQQMFEPGSIRDVKNKIIPAIKENKDVGREVLAATTGIKSSRAKNLEDIMRKQIATRSEYYASTKEERDRQRILNKAADLQREGKEDELAAFQAANEITDDEMELVYKRSDDPKIVSLFKKLTVKEAQKVWQYATPSEKEELRLYFFDKVERSKLQDDEKDAIMDTIDQ